MMTRVKGLLSPRKNHEVKGVLKYKNTITTVVSDKSLISQLSLKKQKLSTSQL